MRNGGADRDRTGDLMLAKHALSQLSYSPTSDKMVGLGRVELPTSPLSGVRSNQLSYRPEFEHAATGSPAAPGKSSLIPKKGFEDKVERAERLRRS